MWRLSRTLLRRDPLNAGSSMTLGSKGMRLSSGPQRPRMPWTAAKEFIPAVVLNQKDKTILDGSQLVELDHIDRSSQVDPLEVLKSAVATYEFSTSTGKNLFQLAAQDVWHGRGQRFFRREWREGTYDKYVTLSAIDFDRDGNKGTAYGYITFHGESTTRPVQIDFADVPGWFMEYTEEAAVPFDGIVPPPPSVGTDTAVDPHHYRLKAYPYYDAPNPPEFVDRLLKERGVLPDLPVTATEANEEEGLAEAGTGDGVEGGEDGSEHYKAPSS